MTADNSTGSESDEALIGAVLEQLYEGFSRRDAKLIDGIYADDAIGRTNFVAGSSAMRRSCPT